ncbi:protein FAM177A1 [Sabethes cyaneus]|uniref:protein FAM177A1 n=1 Tax=Sabethes cyaneus TaxID=53552 RepID=UPI00237DE808|nr:protein FAM177A1 [Sabethes cyaneus]
MTKMDIPMKNKVESSANFIQNEKDVEVQVRAPKRVLHFSDGTMEEFSDDEDQVDGVPRSETVVDESKMNWSDWMLHKTCKLGNTVLAGCDYVGEGLASMLGITTPKYSFEIEEFKRMQAEQHAEDRAIQNFVDQNRPASSDGEAADVSNQTKSVAVAEPQAGLGSIKPSAAVSRIPVPTEIEKF